MTQKIIPSIEFCQSITERRTANELRSISHVKRFLELLTGDQKFRDKIKANPTKAEALAKGRGIDIDLATFSDRLTLDLAPNYHTAKSRDLPLATLWNNWISDWLTFVRLMREDGYSSTADGRFNAWRKRQVERVKLEFGKMRGDAVSHPLFSFELSKGCSIGCWFCGLGSEKFQGYFQRTPKNVALWRGVLGAGVDLFGSAMQTSACYWATEPFDNPDYLDFLDDYRQIIGLIPQTTSAAPLRNIAWTRRLMNMHEYFPSVPSRFSIVNLRILKDLHSAFSPLELLNYELIMQQKGSSYQKTRAGKALNVVRYEKGGSERKEICGDLGSIACLTGYLVNMVEGRIQLISPTVATESWPLGYRVHASGIFSNPREFGDFVESSISQCMQPGLSSDYPVSFRPGVAHESREDGFSLCTDFAVSTFQGSRYVCQLGKMIARSEYFPNQLVALLVDEGADIFELRGTLQDLFERGFLEDFP